MAQAMASHWWNPLVRGVVAIVFGLFALFAPTLALSALLFAFGAYAFIDGVATIYAAVRQRRQFPRWWLSLIEGVIGVVAGIAVFVIPEITALTLLYVIGAWAILTGVFEVVAAYFLRQELANEWLLGLAGVLSVAFGVFAVLSPGGGALALAWLIGVYAIVFGVLLIGLGFRFRSLHSTGTSQADDTFNQPARTSA